MTERKAIERAKENALKALSDRAERAILLGQTMFKIDPAPHYPYTAVLEFEKKYGAKATVAYERFQCEPTMTVEFLA